MPIDSTLRSLYRLFPTLEEKVKEVWAQIPTATLQSRGDIRDDDCTAVLLVETDLTGAEAEALRISKGLPEVYPEHLIVSITHQPTLVFAQVGDAISIELTTSLAEHRKHLTLCNHLPVSILHLAPGDEAMKQAWHSRFQNLHMHGIWFRASSKLVKAIQDLN